jgi:DNA-binding NtrC family response regulator
VSDPAKIDLLLVDDDFDFRSSIARRFRRRGYVVQEAAGGEDALAHFAVRQFDVAVVDLVMPQMSGVELLERLKSHQPECEVVMLTGQATIETAVAAMKLGAYDYVTKPFPLAELESLIERARERRQLLKENAQLKTVLARTHQNADMIGESAAMREVFRLIERAGPTDNAILIQGESGTGKELVARALHKHSGRADKPLVVINCAALPETLLESELFGHEKGAFTGAVAVKPGLFEVADGGTLFVDEIGELAGNLQAKLLRVLEDGSLRRIGSLRERRVDVRLLAATNRDMEQEVQAGRFREDLYYRINVLSLRLPPLRERKADIPALVERFLGRAWTVDPEGLARIIAYDWPGNVRQLINVLERGKIMADGNVVRSQDLPREIPRAGESASASRGNLEATNGDSLADIQRSHIIAVLRREQGNKARAARALGINRRSLYRLLEKYGVTADEAR